MLNRTRFGKWVVVACMGALAACTSGETGDSVGNNELAVTFPNGTTGPFEIGRVTVDVFCTGAPNDYFGEDPSDRTLFTTDLEFENNPSGSAEVWHAFMDLLGDCQFGVKAFEPDGELFCTGSGAANVQPGDNDKVNVTLFCDVSQNIDTGMVDFDIDTTIIMVGNFCPFFHSLELIPDDIPLIPNPIEIPNPNLPDPNATELILCAADAADADPFSVPPVLSSCGNRCDVDPDPGNLGYTCKAETLDAFGGTVTGPSTGTFADPNNQDGDGDPTTYNGFCTQSLIPLPPSIGYFVCSPSEPGVAVRITCTGGDGDVDCDKTKTADVQCAGANLCAPLPPECNDPDLTDCTVKTPCDPTVGGASCVDTDAPNGQSCDFGGSAGICDAGVCVDAGLCDGVICDSSPTDCVDGGTCDPSTGLCPAPIDLDGVACDTTASGPGTCSAGVCIGNCTGVICDADPTDCTDGGSCNAADGSCPTPVNQPPGTTCDVTPGSGASDGQCDDTGACVAGGPPTFNLAGEFRAYNSLLKPEGVGETCVGAPAIPNLSVGGPVPAGPPVGTCTDPDLRGVPGSTTGAGAGIDTQCVSTQGIGGTLTFDDSVSPIAMTGSFQLDFAIDATVDLSSPDCTTILNVVIATSSVNAVSGSGTGSVSDGGSVTLTDPGDGFNVDYTATGTVNCAGAPSTFAATVCTLAGGLAVGDNPLPLLGDPGRRFWPVITFQDVAPADGKLEMQYATGPTTTAGWAMNNPPNLNGPGTQFIATTGVQQ